MILLKVVREGKMTAIMEKSVCLVRLRANFADVLYTKTNQMLKQFRLCN